MPAARPFRSERVTDAKTPALQRHDWRRWSTDRLERMRQAYLHDVNLVNDELAHRQGEQWQGASR